MDIIKALKENERPLILLSDAEMAFIKKSPSKDFIWIQESDAQRGEVVWDNLSNDEVYDEGEDQDLMSVPRLRPDYEEKPSVVECEVTKDDEGYLGFFYDGDGRWWLSHAPCFPDFIGFKYEGGMVRTDSIAYVPDGNYAGINHKMGLDGIESGQVEVVRATHVLFKGGK